MKIANAKNNTQNTITIFYQSNIFDYYIGRTEQQQKYCTCLLNSLNRIFPGKYENIHINLCFGIQYNEKNIVIINI